METIGAPRIPPQEPLILMHTTHHTTSHLQKPAYNHPNAMATLMLKIMLLPVLVLVLLSTLTLEMAILLGHARMLVIASTCWCAS